MTDRDDIDALAGEYVLGTLDAAERAAIAARRLREPDLDAAISDWERRLAPLLAAPKPVLPPPGLYASIEKRIREAAASFVSVPELETLRRSVARWRRLALATTAAAVSLIAAVGLRETYFRPPAEQSYVAVFAKDDILPAFYFTIDLEKRVLTLRPVGAERLPGKSYQLWIKDDALGPQPKSLGLVEANLAPTRKTLEAFDPSLIQRATFGVSIEPEGGSPTGLPSSGALHARLLPAVN